MSSHPFEYPYLAKAAFQYPAIDNHTHPLLNEKHRNRHDFDGLLSEAQGPALADSIDTLACYRATRQLSRLLKCDDEWYAVKEARSGLEYIELCRLCFEKTNIHCLLLDDGLDGEKVCEDVPWHDQFTATPSKRIVRIEVAAQIILSELISTAWVISGGQVVSLFVERFKDFLDACANDPFVAGFKSIACYRSGLDISPDALQEPEKTRILVDALDDGIRQYTESKKIRFSSKLLIDYLVQETLKVAGHCQKPVQFHTGLGDSDLSLSHANPSLLQPLINANPDAPIVLLHASYPFTREAGYLASVYRNVYLDFGEVFPFVSAAGQRKVVEMVLELCPTTKILWSTDGHWWPETYYLANLQSRETLYEVLSDYVKRDEMSEKQAVKVVHRALFENANKLYRLGLNLS